MSVNSDKMPITSPQSPRWCKYLNSQNSDKNHTFLSFSIWTIGHSAPLNAERLSKLLLSKFLSVKLKHDEEDKMNRDKMKRSTAALCSVVFVSEKWLKCFISPKITSPTSSWRENYPSVVGWEKRGWFSDVSLSSSSSFGSSGSNMYGCTSPWLLASFFRS